VLHTKAVMPDTRRLGGTYKGCDDEHSVPWWSIQLCTSDGIIMVLAAQPTRWMR
jgi:hypothetical protein